MRPNRVADMTPEQHAKKLDRDRRYREANRAKKYAATTAWRRKNGVKPRAEYLAAGAPAKPDTRVKLPMEVHQAWSKASPNSAIRRRFPNTAALQRASWDPARGVIV